MKRLITLVAVIAIVFSTPAFSAQGGENNNTGCNGVGNANSPCEGNGGNATANGGSVNSTITNTNVNNNDVRSNANSHSYSNSNSSVRNRVSNEQGQSQDQTASATATNNGVNVEGDESTFIAPPATSPMVGTSSAQITTPFGGVGFSKDAKHAKLITVLNVIQELKGRGVLTNEEANTDSKNVYNKLLKTVCGRSCNTEDKE